MKKYQEDYYPRHPWRRKPLQCQYQKKNKGGKKEEQKHVNTLVSKEKLLKWGKEGRLVEEVDLKEGRVQKEMDRLKTFRESLYFAVCQGWFC